MITTRISIAIALAIVMSLPASAGVREDMDRMFSSSMVHVNNPGASMSMRRGIISGGSISVRNRNVTTGPLFHIEPPFLPSGTGGGCGGFDINFGAISHISSDQLEQLMRSIPSAAVSYAFDLALNAVSPMIQSLVSKYTNMVNELGARYGSSCQIAKAMMDQSGLSGQITRSSESFAAAMGYKEDALNATQPALGDDSSATSVVAADPDALARMSPGNVIWKALKIKAVDGWIEDGDDTLLQDIMSMTGTYISCMPGVEGCAFPDTDASSQGSSDGAPEDTNAPKSASLAPILKFSDLVEGSTTPDGLNGSTFVRVYRCDSTTAQGCLDPRTTEISFIPMRERVLRVVRGDKDDLTDGIIGRMRAGGDPTPADEIRLASMGKYAGVMLYLARFDQTEAEAFAEEFASEIATDILKTYVDQLLQAAEQAAGLVGNELAIEKGTEILRYARLRINLDYENLTTGAGDKGNKMLAYYDLTRRNVLQATPFNRPTVGQR